MRIKAMYLAVVFLMWAAVATLLANDSSPDSKLLGQWKEVMWSYEKLDPKDKVNSELSLLISDQLKKEISKGLVIHKAETWEIMPDGKLLLHKTGGDQEELQWRLKGRGHVLKLYGKGTCLEHYQIQKLTADTLEIHFNSDLQARGIIKMKFVKQGIGK
ncbi:hypothetical protein GCM10028791_21670 [Echinicola sediminis]